MTAVGNVSSHLYIQLSCSKMAMKGSLWPKKLKSASQVIDEQEKQLDRKDANAFLNSKIYFAIGDLIYTEVATKKHVVADVIVGFFFFL